MSRKSPSAGGTERGSRSPASTNGKTQKSTTELQAEEMSLTPKDRLFLRTAVSLLVKAQEAAVKKLAEIDAVVQASQVEADHDYCATTLMEKIRKAVRQDMEKDPAANTSGATLFETMKEDLKQAAKEGAKEALDGIPEAEPVPQAAGVDANPVEVLHELAGAGPGLRLLGAGEGDSSGQG